MICGVLFEWIFNFCRMSIASYVIEAKAKIRQIKTQSAQKTGSRQLLFN